MIRVNVWHPKCEAESEVWSGACMLPAAVEKGLTDSHVENAPETTTTMMMTMTTCERACSCTSRRRANAKKGNTGSFNLF